nr:hypothetical protein [Tanacetum cinerariifolium]
MPADSESVDELFVATFDSIRDSVADAIRNICDLIGTRIIFWDLRDSFLFRLYHGTVEGARLENLFPHQLVKTINFKPIIIESKWNWAIIKYSFS